MQSLKLAALAEYLDAKLQGDPSAEITRVAGIETAEPGDLTFVSNPDKVEIPGLHEVADIRGCDAGVKRRQWLRNVSRGKCFREKASDGIRNPSGRHRRT